MLFDTTRERLIEIVAESDDALMEKYFENGTLDEEDIYPNLAKAIANSKLCPVYAVSSTTLVGLSILLDHIVEFAPNPATHEAEYGFADAGNDRRPHHAQILQRRAVFRLCFPHDCRPVRRPNQCDESRLAAKSRPTRRFTIRAATRRNASARCTLFRAKHLDKVDRSADRRHHRRRQTKRHANRRHALR